MKNGTGGCGRFYGADETARESAFPSMARLNVTRSIKQIQEDLAR